MSNFETGSPGAGGEGSIDLSGLTPDALLTTDGNTLISSGLIVSDDDLTMGDLSADNVATVADLDVGGDATVAGTLLVSGAVTIDDSLDVNVGLNVDGNTTLVGTLLVSGAVTIDDSLDVNVDLNVDGNAVIDGTLLVSGTLTVDDALHVTGSLDVDTDLNVDGNAVIDGTLSAGATTLGGDLNLQANSVHFTETTSAPSGTTQTINIGSGNHQTLNCGDASGNITVTFTPPGGASSGTVIIIQDGTARDLDWVVTGGTIEWLGAEPTWTGDANTYRIVSWRWNPTLTILFLQASGSASSL